MVQTQAEYELALRQAVDRIATQFDPDQIILFGSQARGQGGPDSDADLLVVMPVNGSKRQQAVQIDLALEGVPIPIDLVVVTRDDLAQYGQRTGTIICDAVREGEILYERGGATSTI